MYHIVFTPKYRRKVICGQLRKDIGRILRKLCEMKEVEIIEAHAMPDHIHMLVRIPPKMSVSSFMGDLKGRSATLIHEQHANLKYKYGIKKTKNQWQEIGQTRIFLLPAILVVAVFVIIAAVFALYLSFYNVNLFTGNYEFKGLQNYQRIFTDAKVLVALRNISLFTLVVVPLQTFFSVVIAYALSSKGIKGKKIFRMIYFLHTLTSSSALTIIFMFIFNINGPVNDLLMSLGIYSEAINFLQEPSYGLLVIMVMNIWSTFPYFMTINLASLVDLPNYLILMNLNMLDSFSALILPAAINIGNIFMMRQFFLSFPKDVEEAASIDGLGRF